jgi:hypothetical protein
MGIVSTRKKAAISVPRCAHPDCDKPCSPDDFCESCCSYICDEHRVVDDVFEEGHNVDSHWIDYGVELFEP